MPRWLKQLLSYIISFVVYSMLFNSYSVGLLIVGAIGFHECGHLYAARTMGLKTKGFYLIPFMGGAALIAERYKRYSQMSFVLLAGPIAGAALAVATYGLYLATGSAFLGTAAYWMAALNLFNLIPLAMLDGGQLAEAIVYSFNEKAGAIYLTISYVVGAFVVWHFNPFIAAMIVFFGFASILAAWKTVKLKEQGLDYLLPPRPSKMNWKEIVGTVVVYFATAAVLFAVVHLCQTNLLNISDLFRK